MNNNMTPTQANLGLFKQIIPTNVIIATLNEAMSTKLWKVYEFTSEDIT